MAVSTSGQRSAKSSEALTGARTSWLQTAAAIVAGAISLVYGLLYVQVLQMDGLPDADRGVFGVAALVFAVLATLLWWRRSRVLWGAAALLQVLMGWMYLAIAPERDPPYEVWGITLRVLSVVLVLALGGLWAGARRGSSGGHPGQSSSSQS